MDHLTDEAFDALPRVVEGESKDVRRHPDDPSLCVIRLKPTIYSFSANRAGVVPGSDLLRLRATRLLVDAVRAAGVDHAYRHVGERFIVSRLVANPPPIEVIVKRFHTGTTKHRMRGMGGSRVRASHPLFGGLTIEDDKPYPHPVVRFDWRNPLRDEGGAALADEALGDEMANFYIDVAEARRTALRTWKAMTDFMGQRDVVACDVCLFITEDGRTVFGEISQDCGRFRHFDEGSLDKDVWRAGGSSEMVLQKWQRMLDLLGAGAPQ